MAAPLAEELVLPPREPAAEERRILHFQQYNAALQRTVLEAKQIDLREVLEVSAAEVVYAHLSRLPDWERTPEAERIRIATELFRDSGLGVLQLSRLGPEGGEAVVRESRFALEWDLRPRDPVRSVCALPTGYLRGALAAIFSRSYHVAERECLAQGGLRCRFDVVLKPGDPFPEVAPLSSVPSPTVAPDAGQSTVNESEIVDALFAEPPRADATGHIRAFGSSLTHLWAEYYNRVSYHFEQEIPRTLGAKFANMTTVVLTEAGHTCAFHTFGSILNSPEWQERVAPRLTSREDCLHALVAVINTLGWGTWRVQELVPGERLRVRVYDGYEAVGYRRLFGPASAPKCYLARGAASALMNLLYVGDILQRPALTTSYYNQVFRSPLSFRAQEALCRAMDAPFCELMVNPLSPGLYAARR